MIFRGSRGMTGIEVALALLILGAIGIVLVRPKLFDAESRRAKASEKATVAVVQATAKTDAVVESQGAAAAAYVSKTGEAASALPDSREKQFIVSAIPIALSYLPPPDPKKLLEAEKLKSAFLAGQLELANSLSTAALEESARVKQERDRAFAERDAAISQRRSADSAITVAAAVNLAAKRNFAIAIAIIVLLIAGWAYTKFFSISTGTLGRVVADIRAGTNPIHAMDTNLAPWLHKSVNEASKLATPTTDAKVATGTQ